MVFRAVAASLVVGALVIASVGATFAYAPGHERQHDVLIHPCRLRLPPDQAGLPAFAIPADGRATLRSLPGRFSLCRLSRADGSIFALALIDRLQDVLQMRFFRSSGKLLFAADSANAALGATQGARVGCGSPAYNTLGHGYWQRTIKWWVGKTPTYLPRTQVIQTLRAAQSEWNNNLNWCSYPDHANGFSLYEGGTSSGFAHNGINTVDWGSGINALQGCSGASAIACTLTWYDHSGTPIESDVRFSTSIRWSIQPSANTYDIQSVAAHEFGHVRQLGHVINERLKQYTLVMWPYFSPADTSARKLGRGEAVADNNHY